MTETIQPFLAPAVMISAGGLLCLAQFARFTAVLAQVRACNRERLGVLELAEEATAKRRQLNLQRARGLEQQAGQVLAHARTVRNALRFLVGGILLMVLCSLTIGASLAVPAFEKFAVALFVTGLLSSLAGLCLVLAELGVSLDAIEFEHDNLNRLRNGEGLLPPDRSPSEETRREGSSQ